MAFYDGIMLYFGDDAPTPGVLQATCAETGITEPRLVGIVDLERDYTYGMGYNLLGLVKRTVLLLDPRIPVDPILLAKVAGTAGQYSHGLMLVKVLEEEEAREVGKPVRLLSPLTNDA
jgi:hypothetical protein